MFPYEESWELLTLIVRPQKMVIFFGCFFGHLGGFGHHDV